MADQHDPLLEVTRARARAGPAGLRSPAAEVLASGARAAVLPRGDEEHSAEQDDGSDEGDDDVLDEAEEAGTGEQRGIA